MLKNARKILLCATMLVAMLTSFAFAKTIPQATTFDEDPVLTSESYTITWVVDGAITTTTCKAGEIPVFDGVPEKEPTTQFEYIFSGWYPMLSPCTGDATYIAQFTQGIRLYTVTWVVDGVELQQPYTYGSTPVFLGEPKKEGPPGITYIFTGWSPALQFVTCDVTYTAQFEEKVEVYTITWKDYDGKILKTEEVGYGHIPNYGSVPKRNSEKGIPFTFDKWSPELKPVTEDVTYTATYTAGTGKEIFKVIFQNWDGEILHVLECSPGDPLEYDGPIPTHESENNNYRYVFTGWSPDMKDIKTVEENLVFVAQYRLESALEWTLTYEELEDLLDNKTFDNTTIYFADGYLYLTRETLEDLAYYRSGISITVDYNAKKDIVSIDFYRIDTKTGKETLINEELPGLTFYAPDLTEGDYATMSVNGNKYYEKVVESIVTDEGSFLTIPGTCKITTEESFSYFNDVELTKWYFNDINFAASRDLMVGMTYNEFNPLGDVTRAQALMIVYRMAGEPEYSSRKAYNDFNPTSWYAKPAYWASSCDMLPPLNSQTGEFGINEKITREDLALLLYNFATYMGYDCDERANLSRYNDYNDLSTEDHAQAMSWAVANGIFTGRTTRTLAPDGETTRAEMAATLSRLFLYMLIPADMEY